jgi:DNA-binding PadR family transcriptional regulator
MSRALTTGLSAGEAVLGLVIERPARGSDLERRLKERFGWARYSYSTAYSALRRLEKDGLVRAVEADPSDSGALAYEATAKGVDHFREWVRAPTSTPIPREELHARIALCEPRDLPRLIDVVHSQELACIDELDRIRKRMLAGQAGAALRPLAEQDWSPLMDRGVVHGEVAFWGGRITQLAALRNYLEELRGEAERRALAEHRQEDTERRRAI